MVCHHRFNQKKYLLVEIKIIYINFLKIINKIKFSISSKSFGVSDYTAKIFQAYTVWYGMI